MDGLKDKEKEIYVKEQKDGDGNWTETMSNWEDQMKFNFDLQREWRPTRKPEKMKTTQPIIKYYETVHQL